MSDTNIFIDLIEVGLLEEFFQLPWDIYTTDFVLNELKNVHQKKVIEDYSARTILSVKRYNAEELIRRWE